MNRVIAEFTTAQDSVLHGDHHIIVTVRLKDGIAEVPGGCLLYEDGGAYVPLKATDTSKSPTAVALDAVKGPTSEAAVTAAVHGAVRTEKLCYADGTPVAGMVIPKLRAAGIYAIGALPASASAPAIVSQPQAAEVAAGTAVKLSVAASAPDGGTLTYQWYKGTTSSTADGTKIAGATGSEVTADTAAAGTAYYWCEVTNTLNNTTAAAKTAAAEVKVTVA